MTATLSTRRDPLLPAVALSVWTLAIWTFRIRNIWTDDELTTADQVWRTGLSAVFTVFAGAVLWMWARRRSTESSSLGSGLVRAFAAWTVVVWVIRAVQIALADHSVAFIVVHVALAAVSIALAALAVRGVRSVRLGGAG